MGCRGCVAREAFLLCYRHWKLATASAGSIRGGSSSWENRALPGTLGTPCTTLQRLGTIHLGREAERAAELSVIEMLKVFGTRKDAAVLPALH